MVTNEKEYAELLYKIQNSNHKYAVVNIPKDEPIYYVDLNTRIIQQPQEIINLEFDHNAETIYFSVDRYFDNVDLATTSCIIQYNNANKDVKKSGYIYAVPFFDLVTLKDEGKIVFQWAIEAPVTAFSGNVSFAIKFYKISTEERVDEFGHVYDAKIYDYVLNTLASKLKIEKGMDVLKSSGENFDYDLETVTQIYDRIKQVAEAQTLRWVIMNDDFDPSQPIIVNIEQPSSTINKSEQILNNLIKQD